MGDYYRLLIVEALRLHHNERKINRSQSIRLFFGAQQESGCERRRGFQKQSPRNSHFLNRNFRIVQTAQNVESNCVSGIVLGNETFLTKRKQAINRIP